MKTKSLLIALSLSLTAFFAFTLEEEKELKRPSNIGDSNIDGYVNQCFDIYEGTMKTEKDLATIEAELTKMDTAGHKLKSDAEILKKLYYIQKEIRAREDKVKELDNKTADMVKNAKEFKPIKDSPKAVKNVNNASKALKISQEKTPMQARKTEELIAKANKMVEK